MAKNKIILSVLSIIGFIIILIVIFFSACYVFKAQCGIDISKIYKPKLQPTPTTTITPTATNTQISVAYKGTLPCADCPGLDTELILKKAIVDSIDGTFVMKETYLERDVASIISQGTWKTIFSSSKGKPIVIYELNSGSPDSIQYFLKASDDELKMLDKNKNEIVGPDLNFSLIKIIN